MPGFEGGKAPVQPSNHHVIAVKGMKAVALFNTLVPPKGGGKRSRFADGAT